MTRNGPQGRRRFCIWVDGTLGEGFAEGMEGIGQANVGGETVLSGDYVDESHLQGVLDQLRSLAIGVRRFEVDPRRRREAEESR